MGTTKLRQSAVSQLPLITDEVYDALVKLCQRHHIVYIGIFGSFANGKNSHDSDVDILVRFSENEKITLFDLVDIEDELQSIFGRKVDLVTANSLSPYIRDKILNSVKVIYEN